MPNWCNNDLYITGPKKQIERFKKKAKWKDINPDNTETEGDFKLSSIIPEPPEARIDLNFNWYDWHMENYGCKWDCEGDLMNEEYDRFETDGELVYQFDSPWGPPIKWLEKVSKKFMKLSFILTYEEPGMGLKGEATAEKGLVSDLELPYEPENDE